MTAYQLSLTEKNAQTENLSRTVLRAKQQIWAAKETARLREMNETLRSVEELVERDLERSIAESKAKLEAGEIGEIGFGEDCKALGEDAAKMIQDVREAFRIASKGEVQERVSFFSRLIPAAYGFVSCANFSRLFRTIWLMESRLRSCMIPLLLRLVLALIASALLSMWRKLVWIQSPESP